MVILNISLLMKYIISASSEYKNYQLKRYINSNGNIKYVFLGFG